MTIECCICSEVLLQAGIKVTATLCGHVYHSHCLKSWTERNGNKGICPFCRAVFDPSKVIPLHSLDGNETKAIDGIFDYVKRLDKKDAETRSLMDCMLDSLTKLNKTVDELRAENREMKTRFSNVEKGSTAGPSSNQLIAKDTIIAGLKKEIQDLKAQRSKATKEIEDVQKQVTALRKNEVVPLKNSSIENVQPNNTITLSFKFEDECDRMILGDF